MNNISYQIPEQKILYICRPTHTLSCFYFHNKAIVTYISYIALANMDQGIYGTNFCFKGFG